MPAIMKTEKWSKVLSRCKTTADEPSEKTKLARVLGLLDLTFLGVGATLGLGVYVLAGETARKSAGPAVTISFLIAAIASALAGICYAEFAARVPKAGSAYIYSYVTVGEFCAFVIGWNLILEYAIGTASVANALSLYVDNILNGLVSTPLKNAFPMHVDFLSSYPDFFAAGVVLLLTILLAWGVKESSLINNILTVVNLLTISLIIVAGLFKANPSNWSISKEYAESHVFNSSQPGFTPRPVGIGGFAPFGLTGIMSGAASCFYGFVGFDIIATTGEEAKNPKKNIPLALAISLLIIFFSYFGIATVLTMILPYSMLDEKTPVVTAFKDLDMQTLAHVINVGAISALTTSLLGAIFPLPRIVSAMAEDGLLFKCLSQINEKTKTPIVATVLSGIFTAVIAAIFNLDQLMEMMSIGTLLAYAIVTMCVLLLRYRAEDYTFKQPDTVLPEIDGGKPPTISNPTMDKIRLLFNLTGSKFPSPRSHYIANCALFAFCLSEMLFCFVFEIYAADSIANTPILVLVILTTLAVSTLVSQIILARQPRNDEALNFKVPLVPHLPCASIIMNTYLMVKLKYATWIRFVGWLIIGFLIYIFYSIKNSVQGKQDRLASPQQTSVIKMEEIELKKSLL